MEKETSILTKHLRYKQLDGLRGLAAVFVFFTHSIGIRTTLPVFTFLKTTPLSILFNGNAAVMLFFVLSGFVLSLPYVSEKKPLNLPDFYLKRVFRIYPAFIIAIIFSILLKSIFSNHAGVSGLFFGPNAWNWEWNKQNTGEILKTFLLAGPGFNMNLLDPPVWSLAIEMKMSIILPFLILIASRSNLLFNLLFLAAITVFTYQHTTWVISVFYSGILMAKYHQVLLLKLKQLHSLTTAVLVILALLLYNNRYEFSAVIQQSHSPFKYIWSSELMAAGSCMLIVFILSVKDTESFFKHYIMLFLGNISYSFYLIHIPLLLTAGLIVSGQPGFAHIYILPAVFILTISLSYLMFIFIEQPFQRAGRKLTGKFSLFRTRAASLVN